jgi:hypothetical protein
VDDPVKYNAFRCQFSALGTSVAMTPLKAQSSNRTLLKFAEVLVLQSMNKTPLNVQLTNSALVLAGRVLFVNDWFL